MFSIDASGPAPGEFVLEWLRLAQAGKWVPLNLTNEPDNAERLGAILLDSPGQVLKRGGVEFEASHSASFSTTASRGKPSERCADAMRRFFIVSDFRR
jgi:hypothetical protein